MVMAIAVAASLLAEIRFGVVRVPVIIWEIAFGILIGPHGLGLATAGASLEFLENSGLVALFFMAGMELDLERVKGRPLALAFRGWILSLGLGLAAAGLLYWLAIIHTPILAALVLSTTALGTFLPILRDTVRGDSHFGNFVVAAGAAGEFGPVIAVSLVLTPAYGVWQGAVFMFAFVAVCIVAALVALGLRPPRAVKLLERSMHSSTQLPVCLSILLMASFAALSLEFGFEAVLGGFAAGMVVGLASRGEQGKPFREKMDAICFGFLVPFFFVVSGMSLDVGALVQSPKTMLLVPMFLILLLVVRGVPVLLYRKDLSRGEQWPFALYSATALPLVVAITHIGVTTGRLQPEIAAALVGTGLLSVLMFPTIAEALLPKDIRNAVPLDSGG